MNRNLTSIVAWLAGSDPASLPEPARRSLRYSLLDTVAVAWAARRSEGMRAVSALTEADGGSPRSLLWNGSGLRVPPAAAAFHNGSYAAALDFDSLNPYASHIDAVVIPAALAVAELVHASGAALMAAIAAGSELAYRLAHAGQAPGGWFRTSVYGVFGAAAAAARLLGLDARGTAAALGIALGQVAGTQQGHIERALSKRLLSAFAARAGVQSALLAQAGITGPHETFEGRHGLFALYGSHDPARVLAGLGRVYLLEQTTYKHYPACGRAHAAIEAAVQLANRAGPGRLDTKTIVRVELTITEEMHALVGAPYSTDANAEVTGQFCAQYAVAAALHYGVFGVAQITPAAVFDPALQPLIERVVVRKEGVGTMAPATLRLQFTDGKTTGVTVSRLPGSSADGSIDEHAVRAKAAAALVEGLDIGHARACELVDHLLAVEDVPDVADLFDAFTH